jgi:hypothetical protein
MPFRNLQPSLLRNLLQHLGLEDFLGSAIEEELVGEDAPGIGQPCSPDVAAGKAEDSFMGQQQVRGGLNEPTP